MSCLLLKANPVSCRNTVIQSKKAAPALCTRSRALGTRRQVRWASHTCALIQDVPGSTAMASVTSRLLQETAIVGLGVATAVTFVWTNPGTDVLFITLIFAAAISFCFMIVRTPMMAHQVQKAQAAAAPKAAAVDAATADGEQQQQLPDGKQVSELIAKRRSIFPRDFSGEEVPREVIQQLLEAANWAPTHKKTQPWRFVVLGGAAKAQFEDLTIELCGKLLPEEAAAKTLEKLNRKKAKDWRNVSHYIAICMDPEPIEKPNPEWEELCATAAAVQNMWLLGTALGVAGYWSSWQPVARDAPEMHSFLGLGGKQRCLGVFVLGRSERGEQYRGSRQPVDSKVTWKLE